MKIKYEIKVEQDEFPESPREWDNFGIMACYHSGYNLGDEDAEDNLREACRNHPKFREAWDDDYSEAYRDLYDTQTLLDTAKELDVAIILPLYLYDHSGITMNTTGFYSPWDSGVVGFIYATKEAVRKEFGVKRISKQLRKQAEQRLIGEVETYDQYLRGDVWCYTVTRFIDEGFGWKEDDLNSCCGLYGEEYCRKEAEAAVKEYKSIRGETFLNGSLL